MSAEDFQAINDNAQALYFRGETELLLRVWNQIPGKDRLLYPSLAFRVAQVHADESHHDEARLILKLCQEYCEMHNATNGLVSIYLEHARIAHQENNFEQIHYFIQRVQEMTTLAVHLGEAENTLGKAYQEKDPNQALLHFEAARTHFLRGHIDISEIQGDVARASYRAGSIAIRLRLFDKGWRYLNEAETYARSQGDPTLLSKVLVRMGEAHTIQGNYKKAQKYFYEAITLSQASPQQQLEAKSYLSSLLIFMNNSETAHMFLKETNYLGHTETMVHKLFAETWLHIFDLKFTYAKQLLRRIDALQGDNTIIAQQICLLEAIIVAQNGGTEASLLSKLEYAAAYFEDKNMLIEASQARLTLAWSYMLASESLQAKQQIELLDQLIEIIGHAKHLYRLYELCAPLIGGWLSGITRETIEQSFEEMSSTSDHRHVRVYSFGVPRVFIKAKEYPKGDASSFVGIKLLLWMLEKRQARLEEVIDAVWPNLTTEKGRERFYQTTTNLKRRQALEEWYVYDNLNKLYRVEKHFPHYYDGDDFKQTYDRLMRSQNGPQQFAFGWKLINLYDVFAKGIEEESFQVIRLEYEARYDLVMMKLHELAPQMVNLLPENWYTELMNKLQHYLN